MEDPYLLLGLANDGGEDGLGRVFAGNAGLAATRAIVDHDGGLRHGDKEKKRGGIGIGGSGCVCVSLRPPTSSKRAKERKERRASVCV
jgi:hypothetical protein